MNAKKPKIRSGKRRKPNGKKNGPPLFDSMMTVSPFPVVVPSAFTIRVTSVW